MKRSMAAAAAAAWLAAAVASPSLAFQLETTDDPDCDEAPGVNCPHVGTPLSWHTFPVRYFINSDGSGLDFGTVRNAVSAAFGNWQSASNAGIVFEGGGQTSKHSDGRDGCNVISWVALGNNAADTFAQTIVTFDSNSGELFDADTEMNSSFEFAVLPSGEVDPTDPRADVQATESHEAGHALGLAHENRFGPDVVMFFSDTSGDTTHRTLSSDDRSGVRAIYPAAAVLGAGTSADCAQTVATSGGGGGGGCSLSPSAAPGPLWPVAFLLGALAVRRGRRAGARDGGGAG